MKVYAIGTRQLLTSIAILVVCFGLVAVFSVLRWFLLIALVLIIGHLVLLVRRTWVHVAAAGIAWRAPRRLDWATPTGSAMRDQIRDFSVVPLADGRVVRLSMVDGSTVTLPLRESARKPEPQFGLLTRELRKVLPRA